MVRLEQPRYQRVCKGCGEVHITKYVYASKCEKCKIESKKKSIEKMCKTAQYNKNEFER